MRFDVLPSHTDHATAAFFTSKRYNIKREKRYVKRDKSGHSREGEERRQRKEEIDRERGKKIEDRRDRKRERKEEIDRERGKKRGKQQK